MGALAPTKYHLRSTPAQVTVTRRCHPHEGKVFEVVTGGDKMLVIRLPDASPMRIPRAWTDADGGSANVGGREAVLTVEALREVLQVVDALRRRG